MKKKMVGQSLGQDFTFCSELGSKLSLLFRARPKFLSLVRDEPGPEKSSPCTSVLEGDKIEEKKRNNPWVQGQSHVAVTFFYLFIA